MSYAPNHDTTTPAAATTTKLATKMILVLQRFNFRHHVKKKEHIEVSFARRLIRQKKKKTMTVERKKRKPRLTPKRMARAISFLPSCQSIKQDTWSFKSRKLARFR
jgi:hypothetical protein